MADSKVQLKLNGRETEARLPGLLQPAARSTGQTEDPFLPTGYLTPTKSFDVSTAARSGAAGVAEQQHAAEADEVVVLELADGGTFITSAQRLRETLALTHPELLGQNGEVLLEKLRAEGAAPRGFLTDAVGGLVSKVFTFLVGDKGDDVIIKDALKFADKAALGVTWAGTKALMSAIEKRLDQPPGLYRWAGASGTASDLEKVDLRATQTAATKTKPLLVFIHGTGSSTLGSFGDLHASDRELWAVLERTYTGGIYAFEHRTLSESPIDNALALADMLPDGAPLSLVSHSRGGLVADLLCLGDFDPLIDNFRYAFKGTGDADPEEATRVLKELGSAHAEHRAQLTKLAARLRERRLVVQRYVRTASPAQGTLLASGNFDLFLSGLLTLIGQVPFLFGNPWYSAFKRVVVEIAKNRTNPHLVPGIEAMLPDSPMARLLRDAPVQGGIEMAVIAGDTQGGNMLKRLGVLLTDFLLFDSVDNDLVVDTPAMLAGIASKASSRVLFDRSADVSHFRYFVNQDTRVALRDWLVAPAPDRLEVFRPLPDRFEDLQALKRAARRGADDTNRPVVVVLPGVMGSYLRVNGKDRVWFDPLDIATGGLDKIAWGKPGIEAEDLFAMLYGKLCGHLAHGHRVEPFAYDWRQPLDVLAERFGEFLDTLMKQTNQPIRLLAHSMGGLVVRACIHKRRSVMDELMKRDGARLIMLGTPNQGAHSMVENLLGKGSTLRTLTRLDAKHDMEGVLKIVAGFPGALQLLPKPGFKDVFQGQPDGGEFHDFQNAATWLGFQTKVRDFWFGDGKSGAPDQAVLDAASWLWTADGKDTPSLPGEYEKKCAYVFGVARNTPCGVREEGGRLKIVGTTRGDGTVTWDSGRIGGIGHFFYMQAEHGDLPATKEHFPALVDLLTSGTTSRLSTQPPAVRAIEQAQPVSYDAGPPTVDDPDATERALMGSSLRNRVVPRPKRRLEVAVRAMDLRFLSEPILVGHYERDPIAGPQALIDRELLDGDLSERHSLGLYPATRGSAVVVLRRPEGAQDRPGSLKGAVVTCLGEYDGALSLSNLTDAVRAGVLRYLLQIIDVLGKADREVPLATLLLGYNSSANLTVGASVEALVRGVMQANAKFFETTRLNIRVTKLDIIELYVDTAITAVYALRQMAGKLALEAEQQGTLLVCHAELEQGDGMRQRLFDSRDPSYWPRLMVTDADRRDDECPPECLALRDAPERYEDERRDDREGRADGKGGGNDPARRAPAPVLVDNVRFLYVGQRARAESVMQQRQPGLIEQLVRQQIHVTTWQEDIGRMLFQLMVPHDFKDAARQLDRVVLVVDSYTANLPWELMLADNQSRASEDRRPLAVRTAVVRQLSSSRFRRQVRQAIEPTALVVGNPSVEGFAEAFPGPKAWPTKPPPPLPGAQDEAEAVVALLTRLGYSVPGPVIGDDRRASDVLAALYRQPYRILHISAHGVFNLRHQDGRRRSGVVLSDGLLITAAEIEAMETVPELVFLNCCHLAQVDAPTGRDGNKLAASISRELIQIGVRCVIVAGWAVNDAYAKLFGKAFYEHLLLRRRPFGDAVFEARKAVWDEHKEDITWGAFQAYGDPGWRAEPRGDRAGGSEEDGGLYASPDEALDELARVRVDLARKSDRQSDRELRARVQAIDQMLEKRCSPSWLAQPGLLSALGATWRDLGQFDRSREAFFQAIQAEDKAGRVPIRDIEQLANVEARMGEKLADQEIRAAAAKAKGQVDGAAPTVEKPKGMSAESLINLALRRLDGLDRLVAEQPDPDADKPPRFVVNAERGALRGSAYKRKASLYARRMLAGALSADEMKDAYDRMDEALAASVGAYRYAEGRPGDDRFAPYSVLNRLALDALTPWEKPADRDAAIALAQQCRDAATQAYAHSFDVWDAVMQPEALLVMRLIDGSFGEAGDAGQVVFDEVARAYADTMASLSIRPSQLDSVVSQMELSSRFYDAKWLIQRDAALLRVADRLLELARRLQPGRPPREDRPPSGDQAPTGGGGPRAGSRSAPKTPIRKVAGKSSRKKS